jgi:ATP-dependent RNA helicase DeaD
MLHGEREEAVAPQTTKANGPGRAVDDHDEAQGDAPGPMVLVRVGAGHRDGVRPGDLVGAITGEARITSRQIGKIQMNAGYSLVEVPQNLAGRVVTALRRTTIRGQSVEVRAQ